jgi:hypothetical protein
MRDLVLRIARQPANGFDRFFKQFGHSYRIRSLPWRMEERNFTCPLRRTEITHASLFTVDVDVDAPILLFVTGTE